MNNVLSPTPKKPPPGALLLENADPNERDTVGNSALNRAAVYGHLEIVRMLLDKSARIDEKDAYGNTPLMAVIQSYGANKESITRLLLNRGANIEAKNNDGDTPMSLAVKKHQPQIVDILKETISTRKRLAAEYARAAEDKRRAAAAEKQEKIRDVAKNKPKPGPRPPKAA